MFRLPETAHWASATPEPSGRVGIVLGIVTELTGQKKNRSYSYAAKLVEPEIAD